MLSRVRAPGFAGLFYFSLSVFAILLTRNETGVSAIWPANGLLLAMILLRPREHWWSVMLAGALGGIMASYAVRGPSIPGALFALANMVEVAIAAWATNFSPAREGLAGNARSMMRFTFWAGIVAPAFGGIIGGSIFHVLYGTDLSDAALTWFLADALGLMTFTPFFYALFTGDYARFLRDRPVRDRVEAGLLLLLTALVSTFVFMAHKPLLFFITMPTMLVAFRVGWGGVKIACIIVGVIGCTTTMAGFGPLVHMTPDPMLRTVYLQIFLFSQLLIQWPVAAALSTRDTFLQRLAENERTMRFLASQSSVLMLTFDIGGTCRKAVGATGLLPDLTAEEMQGRTVEQLVWTAGHQLRRAHDMAIDMAEGFHSTEFQIQNGPDDRWLEATFRALEDEDGFCPGTVMTLHDISVRKQQAIALTLTAHTDSLTGLYNRAGFLQRLRREMAGAPSGTFSLAMIDVDRFKLVNDNCGHQTGDAVLIEIARRLKAQLRNNDFVGRMGGDEFVVLLDTPDWSQAKAICARLVDAVRAEPVRIATGGTINTAISCGLSRHRTGLTLEQFLNEADMALYEAKRGGRNQMVAA